MVNDPSAVPGAVVPGKKKKKPRPGSPEQLALQAQRDKRKLFANQATQAREDTYAAQRFSEITDGASQTISKRGVRQRGTSDAQAGTMIREEIAAGKANPQAAQSAGGGFQGTGMDGKPGFQLRTEGERMARIASSPVSGSSRPIFSTKGAGSGDFSTAQSDQYRQKALAMGASAKMPGSPNVVKTTASTPPAWDRGAIRGNAAAARQSRPVVGQGVDVNSPAGQTLKAGFEPVKPSPVAPTPAPSVTPAPVATPKPINPNLTSAPPRVSPNMPKTISARPVATPSGPTATPAAPTRPPMMANTSQALGLGAGGINRAVSGIQAGAAMPGKIAQGTAALASTAALGPIQMGTAQARVAGRKLGTVMGAIKKDLSTARR